MLLRESQIWLVAFAAVAVAGFLAGWHSVERVNDESNLIDVISNESTLSAPVLLPSSRPRGGAVGESEPDRIFLPVSLWPNLRIKIVTFRDDPGLTEDVVSVLEISPREKLEVEEALKDTFQVIEESARSTLKLISEGETSSTYHIGALSEEDSRGLKESMHGRIRAALGETRGNLLIMRVNKEFRGNGLVRDYGRWESTFTFRKASDGTPYIDEEWFDPISGSLQGGRTLGAPDLPDYLTGILPVEAGE